ncbi:MAG: cobalt transporter [Oscillospiraceae bacterium]|nr:cobalt transporter [Oscillospiraceae bacterium]
MHDDHTHIHGHEHEHEHIHEYCCGGGAEHNAQTADENLALLNYMIEHNRHHGEDLHELYHSLADSGKTEASKLVAEALHYYDHGNEKLAEALKLLGGK